MSIRWSWILFGTAAWACGGASSAGPGAPAATSSEEPRHPAAGTVYDAHGEGKTCAPPQDGCATSKRNPDFTDKCRLRGFQTIRCGCETMCTGNVMNKELFYDAAGGTRECAPVDDACTPPETSAAFQDACANAHHRLVTCGCEWLCDGPPKP